MNGKNNIVVYIDESSTLGKANKEPYFIIAAIVLEKSQIKPIKNLVTRTIKRIKKKHPTCDELHSSHMSFEDKQYFFNLQQNKQFSVQYFIARKDQIDDRLKEKSNIAFNYFVYLLLQDILYDMGVHKINVIIDMRNVKVTSEKSLEEYLQLKLVESGSYQKIISVSYGDSKNYKLLQAVDMLANAIFAKYNFNKNHFYSFFADKVSSRQLFPQRWF